MKASFPELNKKGMKCHQRICWDLAHTDVCGLFSTKSGGGAKYFVTFNDDFSSILPLQSKEDVFSTLHEFGAI